ncbi:MAG: chorismate synthase [Candidatus Omnitrophica bacterium]|nr:chorismate synthase [Candidatus Omnitrophota bacterium]
MLRYMTAGESHGEGLVAIIDGFPSGVAIDTVKINRELKRRMLGYGRGGRMKIEDDAVNIMSGLRKKRTIGGPLALVIKNRDSKIDFLPSITKARPGHADLAGALKFNDPDIRNVLERASARETAARVAVGACARILLAEFDVDILSHVVSIGTVMADTSGRGKACLAPTEFYKIRTLAERSDLRCVDPKKEALMKKEIDKAARDGDTLGGIAEVIVRGLKPGLGTYVQWDRRLDGRLARACMAIPAVKGVEIGAGFKLAGIRGSEAHDDIRYEKKKGFYHGSNNAGGLEGGMTNGENIILRVAMKPIATLAKPLQSVDIVTKKTVRAQVERSDTCAVPACGVIAEAAVSFEIADAMVEKFGGDSLTEMLRNYQGYVNQMRDF